MIVTAVDLASLYTLIVKFLLVLVIVNDTGSLSVLYPVGAATSSTVYVPFFKLVITWAFVVDFHLVISLPLESFKTSVAPAKALFVALSNLIILTFVVVNVNLAVAETFCVSGLKTYGKQFCILLFDGLYS